MISKTILLVEFGFMVLYGGVEVIRQARKMRAPRKYKDEIFAWSEHPVSSFKYDTLSQIAISIHWIAVVLIGLIELLALIVHPFSVGGYSFLAFFVMIAVVPIVGYMWGHNLVQPISLALAGDRHYAIAETGILWAGQSIPWDAFTHFVFDRENNMIRLWSSSFHGMLSFLFAPPSEYLSKILELLQSHLPNETTVPTPSLMRQWSFPLIMAAVSGIAVLIALLSVLFLSTEVALIVNGFLMYALMVVGGRLLIRAIMGKKMQPAVLEGME